MNLKKLLLISLTTSLFAMPNIHQQYLEAKKIADKTKVSWNDLNKNLIKTIDNMKKKLPLQQGKGLILEKVDYSPTKRNLTFKYKVKSNKEINNSNKIELQKNIAMFSAMKLCTNPNLIKFFEYKGKVTYIYNITDIKNHKTTISATTDANTCKKEKIW